jgi:dTDP-4-amino-4,6-dideoxygalactose transaminase
MILFSEDYYSKDCIKCVNDCKNTNYKQKCEEYINKKYNFTHSILTTSCTHSLEMMAMLLDIKEGDEVIVPSYTFVSTANAFVKFGAVIKCVDSEKDNPNIDPLKIEKEITDKTKALVIVHYGGWGCNMEKIVEICEKKNIYLLEDAAQAIHSYYKNKAVGSYGILSAFSFHSTKNINCSEGGLLVINDEGLIDKAHIICDKGTNRYEFTKGKVDKYEWVSKGSSYPMGNLNAAYLYSQLVNIDQIINKRKELWEYYKKELSFIQDKKCKLCEKIKDCVGNYHIFYIIFEDIVMLKELQSYLKMNNIQSYTHYNPLHKSEYYRKNFKEKKELKNAEKYGNRLLRLPLHNNLSNKDIEKVCMRIKDYFYLDVKEVKHLDLILKERMDLIELKKQFWNYDIESQKKWIKENVKDNDRHILLYKENVLIGYGLIMERSCKIIDGIIIDEKYRGKGYGGILLKNIMGKIRNNGFLLCEEQNVKYYEKYDWIMDNSLKIVNKEIKKGLYKMKYKLDEISYINY